MNQYVYTAYSLGVNVYFGMKQNSYFNLFFVDSLDDLQVVLTLHAACGFSLYARQIYKECTITFPSISIISSAPPFVTNFPQKMLPKK